MSVYYNDNSQESCFWLRELISAGCIAAGDVDDRSITDVSHSDIRGYSQCHFFAGIGGWSYALRLAGWPDDKEVWTGSCPCQPFSIAGKRRATADERHLWPEFYRLISECKPTTVFGEQVASEDGLQWLDGVFADVEISGYATAGADLCAACVGAPEVRQRLYWVADSESWRWAEGIQECRRGNLWMAKGASDRPERSGVIDGLGVSNSTGREQRRTTTETMGHRSAVVSAGYWDKYDVVPRWNPKKQIWEPCRVEPGVFPLVDGFPERVGLLRGYGNAIVPQVAAEFIQAYCEARGEA